MRRFRFARGLVGGWRRRRNGSMRHGREAVRRAMGLWMRLRGMAIIAARRGSTARRCGIAIRQTTQRCSLKMEMGLSPLDNARRTRGGCTTCWGMCGNGRRIGSTRGTTSGVRGGIRRGRKRGKNERFAGVPGTTFLGASVFRTAVEVGRVTGTSLSASGVSGNNVSLDSFSLDSVELTPGRRTRVPFGPEPGAAAKICRLASLPITAFSKKCAVFLAAS